MPRLGRLPSIPFGWYYVALHAERGRTLVRDRADLNVIGEMLRATLKRKGAHLHAASVTPNEVHLAIQNGEQPVSAITRSFCRVYAWRFNRTYHESGELFRAHPHVLLIQHQLWLVPLAHLIHWIPRLRSFKPGAANCWCSSDLAYRRRARRDGLITDVVFRIVSGGSRRRRPQDEAYRKRFDEPPNAEHLRLFAHGALEDPRMVGDSEFIAGVWRTTRQRAPRQSESPNRVNGEIPRAVSEMIERFGVLFEGALSQRQAAAWKLVVSLDNLCSHSRKRPLPMIRAICASHVIERHIATRAEMARFFGCRPESLSAHRRRHQEVRFAALFPQSLRG
jgi:REP element-mobilizing transposase RayT